MQNLIISWDHQIFFWINQLNQPWLEISMPVITDLHRHFGFYIVYLTLVFWSFFKHRQLFYGLLALILVLAFNDFMGGQLKDFFSRLRPDRAGLDVILRAPHFNGGSFPSNHAMNTFCMASFLGRIESRLFLSLMILALIIGFSRVYCGVHFPLDVLAGGILGSLIGKYSYQLIIQAYKKFQI